ncbi:hypothetical protein [Actibacterium lipolyticum]|uniref:Alpha/beta hydrolase n=1 Tax=Actibacterium lipolyticum TaxID=1524263 RepID=A0A238JVR3_9RHOB|nr:hypothetical protein [Actibacterium lipolyticum]SMX34740.1 hypothetical protein COL8621_01465 [Actibacterium lipolyticum]
MAVDMIGWGAAIEESDSDQLIVFVSGYGRPTNQQFHFAGYAEQFTQNKLFLRDHANCQYAQGISGVTDNEEENLEFLRYLIKKLGVKRVSFVSGSVGSHPTVIWGHKLGVNDIHLIGPVTDMDSIAKTDRGQQEAFQPVAEYFQSLLKDDYPYSNLREFMKENSDKVDSVDIYYGLDDPTDMAQAAFIEDLPHVRSTIYHKGDHFRVPMFVQRRDPDMANRISAPSVVRPADMRKAGTIGDTELGHAVVRYV